MQSDVSQNTKKFMVHQENQMEFSAKCDIVLHGLLHSLTFNCLNSLSQTNLREEMIRKKENFGRKHAVYQN